MNRMIRTLLRPTPKLPPYASACYATLATRDDAQYMISRPAAEHLYEVVRSRKPTRVVELGTGIGASTQVIACALRDNGGGILVTVEQSQAMRETAEWLMPDLLARRVTFLTADVEHNGEWVYYNVPEVIFFGAQLVVIDGPASPKPSWDLGRAGRHLGPGTLALFDGRRVTQDALEAAGLMNVWKRVEPNLWEKRA